MNFSTTREHGSLEHAEPTEKENKITGNIIGAAIDVHRILGPGLLESAYEACLISSSVGSACSSKRPVCGW